MNAAAGLDAGLLVGGEHEIADGNPVTDGTFPRRCGS
jgi:hypothetical protein